MRRLKTIAGMMIIALLMVLCMTAAGATAFEDDIDAIDQAAKSVLMLVVLDKNNQPVATGSGFVAFDNYTLVTNFHVMEGASTILATSDSGNQYLITKVIAADEQKDIALLEFFSPTNLQPLTMEEQNLPRRAEHVVTIGSPKGVTNSVTMGNISAIYQENGVSYIQFSAPISPGSSGGALFNNYGNIIGITSAAYIDTQNMNLAVDISEVIKLHKEHKDATRVQLSDYVSPTKVPPSIVPPSIVPTVTPKLTPTPTLTPGPTPDVPKVTDIRTTCVNSSIYLDWYSIGGVEKYEIYRSQSPQGEFILIDTVEASMYQDTQVQAGQTYYYKVKCLKDGNSFDASAQVKAVMPTPTPRPSPVMTKYVDAISVNGDINVTWTSVAGVKAYDVYRSSYLTDGYILKGSTVEKFYLDKNVKPGVYFYKVQSNDGESNSGMSYITAVVVHGFTESTKQKAPRNVKAERSRRGITIKWQATKGADGYIVYRSADNEGPYTAIGMVIGESFEDVKPLATGNAHYSVKSVSGSNISKFSTTVKVPKPTPTPKPTRKPKPTPTPYREPVYPIEIGNDGYVEYYKGYPRLNPRIVNISGRKTVDGFTLSVYCENVYGERIKQNGYGSDSLWFTYSKTIKPGRSTYPGYAWMEEFDGAKYVYVAIVKIHTSDGMTYDIPESKWDYYYWTLD